MDFSNKTALITGSGQGVGEGIARALHHMGANVAWLAELFQKLSLLPMI